MSNVYRYILFTLTLIVLSLWIGPMFYLAEVVVVVVSMLVIYRHIKKMSLSILSIIVVAITIIMPMAVIIEISSGSELRLSDYLMPVNLQNIKTLSNLFLPYLIFLLLVVVSRKIKKAPMKKNRK